MYEQKNVIDVYTYESGDRGAGDWKDSDDFYHSAQAQSADSGLLPAFFSGSEAYVLQQCGDETVSMYKRDEETGLLEQMCCLPISGEYPKDIAIFPDDRHLASINHESDSITFFKIDYEKGLLIMSSTEIQCNEPNSCVIVKVSD